MSGTQLASRQDTRFAGLMMDTLMQAWAGRLGGGPLPDSPLGQDLMVEDSFATARLDTPVNQAWSVAQALGQAATDHETVIRETLLHHGNGAGSCPVSSLETLARAVLELLATQAWLIEPSLQSNERIRRFFAIECVALRNQWRLMNAGITQAENPPLKALATDADSLGIPRDQNAATKWVGIRVPSATTLAGQLLARYSHYEADAQVSSSEFGELMYRLLSQSVHGSIGHLLGAHVPTGDTSESGLPIMSYGLEKSTLWLTVALIFVATFAARATYAEWLGIEMPPETRRLHLHHIDRAIKQLDE